MKKLIQEMFRQVNPQGCRRRRFFTHYLLFLLTFAAVGASAQNGYTVSGTVVNEKQQPIVGVTVVVKGNNYLGTITGSDGKFTLNLPAGEQTLNFSFVGLVSQEVRVAARRTLNVVMKESAVDVDEIVVVGFGQQKKESVVGAISQVSGKVLERAGGVSNIGAAITGNLPGVVTTASTGMPGDEDPRIIIRGQSTWNNSDPLVLVDGIERPMNSVDILSVESISVLKDASATAVFGVRGANGVILVTTKRGKEGKTSVNITVNNTLKAVSKLPGKYDSYDALRIRNMAIERELGLDPNSWADITPQEIINKYRNPANLEESERYPNVNWANELFKDFATAQNANVSISGGTPNVKYFSNVDYLSEGDLFRHWDNNRGYPTGYGFDRMNVRSNLDIKITNTTQLRVNLSGSYGVKRTPWDANGAEYGMWQGAYSVPPDAMMPRYSDGTWGYYQPNIVGAVNSARNLATSGQMSTTTTQINTDFTLDQDLSKLLKGLNARGTIAWDNTFIENRRGINDLNNGMQLKWINPATGEVVWDKTYNYQYDFQEGKDWAAAGGTVDNNKTYRKLFYQMQLNYLKTVGYHNITAMGLVSRDESARGPELTRYREDWVFRTTYDYARKYLFEYNGAYNGSDQFAKEYRFKFFSSAAIGWTITEENFMKPVKFLDMLKIRASYGDIGNDNVDTRYLYLTQIAYDRTAMMGPNNERSPYTWYRESSVGNPKAHWESVTKMNLGADFTLFKGFITGSANWFKDKRSEILIKGADRAIPSYYGAVAPTANLGKVTTQGYEIELKFNKSINSNLRVWVEANMTHAKDKIIDADDPALLPEYQKKANKQIGQTRTYVSSGYYNTWDEVYGSTIHSDNDKAKLPGNLNIVDFNGDGVIDTYDNIPYGFPERPQNTYNANFGFQWKGFSGFIQFYGVNNVTRQVVFTTFPGRLNVAYDEGSYWSKYDTNADSPMPRWITSPSSYNNGSRYMYDGSYVRLKNAEVSYTFTTGWIKKTGMQSMRLYLNGNNLWVWSKMPDDRESNFAGTGWASQGAYPTVKRFNLGVNIIF